VHNFGNPISANAINKIFDPFFQIRESKSLGGGWGLGLYLVREIVQAHGGSLSVKSGVDGTFFLISLPKATKIKSSP